MKSRIKELRKKKRIDAAAIGVRVGNNTTDA